MVMMKKFSYTNPIIIIGMHRSGTSMITKFLGEAGLATGKDLNIHSESELFFQANEWILRLAGGSWDNPTSIKKLLENPEILAVVRKQISHYIFSFRGGSFLGWSQFLKNGSIKSINYPWGWKDPRNSFTLPLWLSIFPDAKIIHIYRHGIDVAQSLCVRQMKGLSILEKKPSLKRKIKYVFSPLPAYFLRSVHLTSVADGLKLWETYLNEEIKQISEFNRDLLQIRYEDFLTNPEEKFKLLVNYCGLKCTENEIKRITSKVDSSRAYAYKESDMLKKVAAEHSALLSKYDY